MDNNRYQIEQCGIEETAGFKNIIAIRDYARATRDLFRELQKETEAYKNQIQQQNLQIEGLRTQIQQLHIKIYQNKATS